MSGDNCRTFEVYDLVVQENGIIRDQEGNIVGRLDDIQKYHELVYAVASKYPNETRHETALRYIKNAESSKGKEGQDYIIVTNKDGSKTKVHLLAD